MLFSSPLSLTYEQLREGGSVADGEHFAAAALRPDLGPQEIPLGHTRAKKTPEVMCNQRSTRTSWLLLCFFFFLPPKRVPELRPLGESC